MPRLRSSPGAGAIVVDGRLDEPEWAAAETAEGFLQTDPAEGMPASGRTQVRVLTSNKALVIGVVCDDAEPDRIVSFSVRRDAPLNSEDHVRIVVGPFLDGRSGYVFAVNPSGARYDGLINPGGENDNPDWDGIWRAAASRSASGWTAEIEIPVQTLTFKPGLHEWHFNVQRRIQRRLETDRWAFPARQYQLTQTSRAGLLTNLPDFSLGSASPFDRPLRAVGASPLTARPWRATTSTNRQRVDAWDSTDRRICECRDRPEIRKYGGFRLSAHPRFVPSTMVASVRFSVLFSMEK